MKREWLVMWTMERMDVDVTTSLEASRRNFGSHFVIGYYGSLLRCGRQDTGKFLTLNGTRGKSGRVLSGDALTSLSLEPAHMKEFTWGKPNSAITLCLFRESHPVYPDLDACHPIWRFLRQLVRKACFLHLLLRQDFCHPAWKQVGMSTQVELPYSKGSLGNSVI